MTHNYDDLLRQAERCYRAVLKSDFPGGNSTNMIFEMFAREAPMMLRISRYTEKKRRHVNLEIGWLSYLAEHMGNVARPLPSLQGRLYETVESEGERYILCAFERAPGRAVKVDDPGEWNHTLFTTLGAIMGDMHRLTKNYLPDEDAARRFAWYNDVLFEPEYDLPPKDPVAPLWEEAVNAFDLIPKSRDTYGIIHNDLHHENFYVEGDKITVFDFDDCICSWYAYDVAITLFQAVMTIPPERGQKERDRFAGEFLTAFLSGYQTVAGFDEAWLAHLDLMLKYRRMSSYKFVRFLVGDEPGHRHRDYLEHLRRDILEDQPFVRLDYDRLAAALG